MGSSVEGLPDFLFLGFTGRTGFDILALVLLVAMFTIALTGGLSFGVLTLYFAMIQTIIALVGLTNGWEECPMTYGFLVASGTHGVVQMLWRG